MKRTISIIYLLFLSILAFGQQDLELKAMSKISSGDLWGADKIYKKIIKEYPDYGPGYIGKATVRAKLRKYDDAIQLWSKAIELNPEFGKTYGERAISKYWIDDFTGAVQDFSQALKLDPDLHEYYEWRAKAKQKLNDCDGALEDINKGYDVGEIDLDLRAIWKGNCGDYNGAIEDYTQSINEGNYNDYSSRARMKVEIQDYEGAIADYEKYISFGGPTNLTYINIGDIKLKQGMTNEACEYFRKAQSIKDTPMVRERIKEHCN